MIYNLSHPYEHLKQEAAREAAEYLKPHISKIIFLQEDMCNFWYQFIMQEATVDGLHAEFGVHTGNNINAFSALNPKIKWYGFDSFYGLNENWKGGLFAKGFFSLNGEKPKVNSNVELVVGTFQNTLVPFLQKHKEPFSVVYIDCDTYESTKHVLDAIGKDRLISGTIICFDEYFGYPGWKFNEFKAWQECCNENNIRYEYIIVSNWAVAVKIL